MAIFYTNQSDHMHTHLVHVNFLLLFMHHADIACLLTQGNNAQVSSKFLDGLICLGHYSNLLEIIASHNSLDIT